MDYRILALLLGYSIGLIQTAYIVGRLMGKIDIREHGSGNAGATNVVRVMGAKAGIAVFLADISKCILAFIVCALIWNGSGTFLGYGNALPGLYGAIGCILGHCFPFYMKFKGGKGVAATIGLMISVDIRVFLISGAIGIVLVLITKYISLASLSISVMMPIVLYILGYPLEAVALCSFITVLVWYLHRANISRLVKGEENKFSFKKRTG